MKKIYCELHLFSLNQNVYILDLESGNKELVATTAMEQLPEVISAVSDARHIPEIMLYGNSILGAAVSEDIIAYSKMHYSWNEIKVEVVK